MGFFEEEGAGTGIRQGHGGEAVCLPFGEDLGFGFFIGSRILGGFGESGEVIDVDVCFVGDGLTEEGGELFGVFGFADADVFSQDKVEFFADGRRLVFFIVVKMAFEVCPFALF